MRSFAHRATALLVGAALLRSCDGLAAVGGTQKLGLKVIIDGAKSVLRDPQLQLPHRAAGGARTPR